FGNAPGLVREVGVEDALDVVALKRLEQVVVRAGLDGADGVLDVVDHRRHDDADVGPPQLDPVEQVDAVDAGHLDVEEDQVDVGLPGQMGFDVFGNGL